MSTNPPKSRLDAIRVILLASFVTSDNDLVVAGTQGTLLRWETVNGKDSVIVAWDAYMFVGSDQCCSRHVPRGEGGFQWVVDINAIRYIGAGPWVDEILPEIEERRGA